MREVVEDVELVAYCGLYCGACGAYLKERCPGCHENKKATWCKVRICCADCEEFPQVSDCRKYNNLIAKLFGLVFRSNRAACISQITELGMEGHAAKMAGKKKPSIRR
jgi:hypothetical protein